MSEYTPAPHEARARFISGSIDLIQRRDSCTLADAEGTAIGEWERWMEWHNVRVRRGAVAEQPEWEYGIAYAPGNEEFEGQDLATIQRRVKYIRRTKGYYSATVHAVRRRRAGDSVPVEQEGAGDADPTGGA